MDIRSSTPEPSKKHLRNMKKLPMVMKAVILKGCKDKNAYIQFHKDIVTYGMWEALLYVEGYESDGYYEEGTAFDALDAWFKKGANA